MTVEAPRKKNDIVHWTRCQCYGHTKTYCARSYTCVKCGGEHNTTLCKNNPNTPAKCALCGGNDTATYKGCDIYKTYIKQEAKQQLNHDKTSLNHITQILTPTIIINFLL
jgi:hypothetical protein